jgi:threonine dehydrogenase-like Zn-dependent dehydrogenase
MKTIYWDKHIPKVVITHLLRRVWAGVVWSPLSSVIVADVPEPPLPGPHWLRVRNRQCGICASDLSTLYANPSPEIAIAALPGINRVYLGHEAVGDVVEVGEGVTRFKVGDRVVIETRPLGSPNCHTQDIQPLCLQCANGIPRFCENEAMGLGPEIVGGGWSEGYIAHESEVWPVPDNLDDDQASLIEPMAVALHGVLRRPPESGEHVLVIGAGVIGLLVTQMVKMVAPDCELTVMARYPHQAETALKYGADRVLSNPDQAYAKFAEITAAKYYTFPLNKGMLLGGFGVVYDCVGRAATIQDALRWAKAKGSVVVVGLDFSSLELDLSPIWLQEVDLLGSHTFGLEDWEGRRVHTYELIIDAIQTGSLSHEGLITHRFPLDQYKKAIATAMNKKTGAIKVTFEF